MQWFFQNWDDFVEIWKHLNILTYNVMLFLCVFIKFQSTQHHLALIIASLFVLDKTKWSFYNLFIYFHRNSFGQFSHIFPYIFLKFDHQILINFLVGGLNVFFGKRYFSLKDCATKIWYRHVEMAPIVYETSQIN